MEHLHLQHRHSKSNKYCEQVKQGIITCTNSWPRHSNFNLHKIASWNARDHIKQICYLLHCWNNSAKVVAVFRLLLKYVSDHLRHESRIIPVAVKNTDIQQARNVEDVVLVQNVAKDFSLDEIGRRLAMCR